MINKNKKIKIENLKLEYDHLRSKREDLLKTIEEVELPEMVYNSNAMENSSLTLKEKEKILQVKTLTRYVSEHEINETLNQRIAYMRGNKIVKLSEYVKTGNFKAHFYTNLAKRQTIPAFRKDCSRQIEKKIVRNII